MHRRLVYLMIGVVIICLLFWMIVGNYTKTDRINSGSSVGIRNNAPTELQTTITESSSKPSDAHPKDYPKASPFVFVQWEEDTPIVGPAVKVGNPGMSELVSIDNLSTSQIIASCRSIDRIHWRKVFEEDLVEALAKAGDEQVADALSKPSAYPRATVTMTVRTKYPPREVQLENVPVTNGNLVAGVIFNRDTDLETLKKRTAADEQKLQELLDYKKRHPTTIPQDATKPQGDKDIQNDTK